MAQSNGKSYSNGQSSLYSATPVEFRREVPSEPPSGEVQGLLLKLDSASNENDSKLALDEIVNLYIKTIENSQSDGEIRDVIIKLFTEFNGKKQLKKYIQEVLTKKKLICGIIKETACALLDKIERDRKCNVKKCNEFLHFVALFMATRNFDYEENFKHLFPLYYFLADNFGNYANKIKNDAIPDIEEVHTLMNAVYKQMLPVFVKKVSFMSDLKNKYLESLQLFSYILLHNEKLGFDLRIKICLVFIYTCFVVDGEDMSIADLISKDKAKFCLTSQDRGDCPPDYYVIMFSSILSVWPEEKLKSDIVDKQPLLYVLFQGILDAAKSNPNDVPVIVEASRALCHAAKHLKYIPFELLCPTYVQCLYHVSANMDHFVDTVRNHSKAFFEQLVTLAAEFTRNDPSEPAPTLSDILLDWVPKLPEDSTTRFLAYEHLAHYYGCEFLLLQFLQLPNSLLDFVDNPILGEQVAKTYQVLLEKSFSPSDSAEESEWLTTWVLPAVNILKSGKEREAFCQKVICTAFSLQPTILMTIFPNGYLGSVEESKVLLHCLHNARKNGIETSLQRDGNLYWRGLIDKQKMDLYMTHQNEEIRLLALAAVTESLKSTELFLDWEFIFLINYIRYNISAQSSNVRNEIINYYKKVLTRYDAGHKVIQRNITTLTNCIEAGCILKDQKRYLLLYQELKKSYRRFIGNLTTILIANLSYDSNYPRRATSLELLLVIKDMMTSDQWKQCWSEDDVKNSHNILFDSYEGNKKMIVKLLKTLPPNYLGFTNVSFTFKYMQRSMELALDVKPSKTLSAAYLFELCSHSPYFCEIVHFEYGEESVKLNDPTLDMIVVLTRRLLNQSTEIVVDNLATAKTAVYGLILSIRHLLENRDMSKHNDTYAGVFVHLVSICSDISEKIMPIVCNPSPEGYMPDNIEEDDSDESPSAQKVLVYAWRTMKELTLLLAEIVQQSVKLEKQLQMLPDATLTNVIGDLFIKVFIQSKHRGVFEQAHVGFSIICGLFWKSSNAKLNAMPKKWLYDAVDLCTGKVVSDDLCATRRSAGLPFLILSILTTGRDPSYFHNTMQNLFKPVEEFEDGYEETRMHCMNVLRALFRHSKLGDSVAAYVARGVIASIKGFKSEAWGVRNSSTLFFAALMTRIFGVQRVADPDNLSIKNKLTIKVFLQRYPELYNFMLDTLKEECRNQSSLILQPVLMILTRLYPSSDEDSDAGDKILPHLQVILGHPVYSVRDAAARAIVPLIPPSEFAWYFDECFELFTEEDLPENKCHGALLQVYYMLKSNQPTDLPLKSLLERSHHILENSRKRFSHMTISLYNEVLGILLCLSDFDDLTWLKRIVIYLSKNLQKHAIPLTWKGNYTLTSTMLTYYIIINKFEDSEHIYRTLSMDIIDLLFDGSPTMKRFVLELLICLNQKHVRFNRLENVMCLEPAEHALYETGDLEISEDVRNLVNTFPRVAVESLLKNVHPSMRSFLVEELKVEQYIRKEDQPLLFLLLNFYPCSVKFLRLSKQETLNTLLSYCDCDNEELISAVISCISTLLAEVDYTLLRYDKLLEVLSNSASPAAALHRRLTVCDFLCKNELLYCDDDPVLKGNQLCQVFNIVMILLEDENLDVRNAMSAFENALKVRIRLNNSINQTIPGHRWPVVPEKAREDLIHLITVLLPQEKAVCLIFSWACRYFPDHNEESQELFERGGINQFAENTPIIDVCSRVLIKMLWTLPEGVSYENKSIFLEEQTQVVTYILLNSLVKYDSPMMLARTKTSVICALKSLYKFLENAEINQNFPARFRGFLNETILGYLTNHLDHGDLFSVKKVFKKLYDPVFRQRR